MKTKELRNIYDASKIVLGILLILLSLVIFFWGIMLPADTPESVAKWVGIGLFVPALVGCVIAGATLDNRRDSKLAERKKNRTRQEVFESALEWAKQAYFGYECAKRVVDKYFTPEEVEILYDRIAVEYARTDKHPLPEMQTLNLDRMTEKGSLFV